MDGDSIFGADGGGEEHDLSTEEVENMLADAPSNVQQPTQQQEADVSGLPSLPPLSPLPMPAAPDMSDLMNHIAGGQEIAGITMNDAGELEVTDYVVSCHQAPYRNTFCPATGKQIMNCGGVGPKDAPVKRNVFLCRICPQARPWSQILPSLLQPGQDPKIDNNCKKAVLPTDPRRSGGYRHSIRKGGCGLFLKKEFADRVNELPCTCKPSKGKEKKKLDDEAEADESDLPADLPPLQALAPVGKPQETGQEWQMSMCGGGAQTRAATSAAAPVVPEIETAEEAAPAAAASSADSESARATEAEGDEAAEATDPAPAAETTTETAEATETTTETAEAADAAPEADAATGADDAAAEATAEVAEADEATAEAAASDESSPAVQTSQPSAAQPDATTVGSKRNRREWGLEQVYGKNDSDDDVPQKKRVSFVPDKHCTTCSSLVMSNNQTCRWHTQCSHPKCAITACLRCAGFQDEASADKFKKQEQWCCILHDRQHRHAWHCAGCDCMISDLTDRNLTEAVSCEECEQWYCPTCLGFGSCMSWSDREHKKWAAFAEDFVCSHCAKKKLPNKKRS